MKRQFFVGGNWKMNGSSKLISSLSFLNEKNWNSSNVQVVVAPPFPFLEKSRLHFDSQVQIAGQNIYHENSGAFTGEVSASMLNEVGAEWVILGHSERRQIFKESDEMVGKKIATAILSGLGVIFCIGETLAERENHLTFEVVFSQLEGARPFISDWSKIVIAYEPVWAIGTGKVATPDQAQEVHLKIREWLSSNISPNTSISTRIIYGGSVNGANCNELAKQADIDGFLVGGSSLKPEFQQIIESSNQKKF